MPKTTKEELLFLILHFGRDEEMQASASGNQWTASRILNARHILICALMESIREMKATLDKMITPEEGERPLVKDESVRKLAESFRDKLTELEKI